MKIIRVFAGSDGESHFEEVSFEEMQGIVDRVGQGDVNINRRGIILRDDLLEPFLIVRSGSIERYYLG